MKLNETVTMVIAAPLIGRVPCWSPGGLWVMSSKITNGTLLISRGQAITMKLIGRWCFHSKSKAISAA